MTKWYSLFSHTGRETAHIWFNHPDCIQPELAITNNEHYAGPIPCMMCAKADVINEWLVTPGLISPKSIITLNGYMRILPKYVLDYLAEIDCKVYNIHPAPIHMYPDLKGKDPQLRLYEGLKSGKYKFIGAVIHEVDAGVDTGKIVYSMHWMPSARERESVASLFDTLHNAGTHMWRNFFEQELWLRG